MLGQLAVVAALALAGVASVHAGARRTVWMPSNASGARPELELYPSGEVAGPCREAMAQARAHPGETTAPPVSGAGKPPGVRGEAAYGPEVVRAACRGVVGLRHATTVELIPPPEACGAGLVRVRVLDGTFRGRMGCVRAGDLRVP